ncbi:MAG: hypothetical protein QM730_20785 [Anaerolineales bacterium]
MIGLITGLAVLVLFLRKYHDQNEQLKIEYERKLSEQEKIRQFDIERIQKESDLERWKREEQKRSSLFKLAFYSDTSSLESELVNEVSKISESTTNLYDFAQSSADFLAKKLNLYHTGIYWVDTHGDIAKLIAGTGEGGKRMIELGHKLSLRIETGNENRFFINAIVLCVNKNAVCFDVYAPPHVGIFYAYISRDLQDNTIPSINYFEKNGFESPDLPQTHQRLVLPLRTDQKVIGALDIHTSAMEMGRKSAELLLPIANLIARVGVNFGK